MPRNLSEEEPRLGFFPETGDQQEPTIVVAKLLSTLAQVLHMKQTQEQVVNSTSLLPSSEDSAKEEK